MSLISSIRAAFTSGPRTAASLPPGEAAADGRGVPLALKEAKEKQRQQYTDANGRPITVRYDGRDMPFGSVDQSRLPAGSFSAMMSQMRSSRDAGNAVVVANNATLHTLTYCYGTHKPMEAWLTKVPADGKLTMHLIATPSTHVGSTAAEQKKNYDTFSKTNVYNLEIIYPDGTRELKKFDVEGNSPPKYDSRNPSPKAHTASASPEFTIDLHKWAGKGDIRIRGWADGSAGVEGYKEHRETVLHL
jgi:hypothetical protein